MSKVFITKVAICTCHINLCTIVISIILFGWYTGTPYISDAASATGRNFHFCCPMMLNELLSRKYIVRKLEEFL
jgi:hypothetical protein